MAANSYLIYFVLVLRIGRSREYIDLTDGPILITSLRILA